METNKQTKTEKERRGDINAVTKFFLVSCSSDEFSTTANLLTHPSLFQFPVLENSLLFLVYTIQIIPPMQTQEIRMYQKRKTQIHNNTHMSNGQNQNNSDSKVPFSSATDRPMASNGSHFICLCFLSPF